ncbi:MAG: hypothetical protein KDK70_39495 [Myxococcales bacterium]|nr:hypothetical protein [Myxococcales bacterium]
MARRRRQRRREWIAASLLALGGCASTCGDSSDPGAIGELGNGRFLYECGGTSDPVCEFTEPGETFPQCIALGGIFDLEYQLLDGSALENDFDLDPVLYVESINQGFFRGTDDFEARRTGEAAFVARESEYVLDLIHLRIVEPDDFDIVTRDPAEPTQEVTIEAGSTEVYRVFPRSVACEQLGGAVPITANSSDETVASTSGGDVLRVQAQSAGTAVVRVQLGDLEKMLTVHVVGDAPDPDTDSATGSDSGTTADPATTGDTDTDTDSAGSGSSGGSSSGGV